MKFLVGVIFGVVLVALGVAAIVYTGSFNTAATVAPGVQGARMLAGAARGGRLGRALAASVPAATLRSPWARRM